MKILCPITAHVMPDMDIIADEVGFDFFTEARALKYNSNQKNKYINIKSPA